MISTSHSENRKKIIEANKINAQDTGSSAVQIALLTHEILTLNTHCMANPKDNSSRRGLNNMVARRRKLLAYLKRNDSSQYSALIARLGLRS